VLRPRFLSLAVVVTLLVAVVGLVARGRPLGSRHGSGGLPLSFWDYAYTTTAVVSASILLMLGIVAIFVLRRNSKPQPFFQRQLIRSLATLVFFVMIGALLLPHIKRLHLHQTGSGEPGPLGGQTNPTNTPGAHARPVHFRWDEVVVLLALVLVTAAIVAATRTRRKPRLFEAAPEALAAALEESLDDLRADPDLRRAIVAAYARMEAALAAAGIPRAPAEAPLEYLERALLSLHTSAEAVRRLTDLFEWARFSQHEPEPSMRDDAVDALIAVRDELRASELTPA
jgi:hypothetical protein